MALLPPGVTRARTTFEIGSTIELRHCAPKAEFDERLSVPVEALLNFKYGTEGGSVSALLDLKAEDGRKYAALGPSGSRRNPPRGKEPQQSGRDLSSATVCWQHVRAGSTPSAVGRARDPKTFGSAAAAQAIG